MAFKNKSVDYFRLYSLSFAIGIVLWMKPFILKKYVVSFDYILKEEMPKYLIGTINENIFDFCPPISPYTSSNMNYEKIYDVFDNVLPPSDDDEQFSQFYSIQTGGTWKPNECISKYKIVIIVPYRNRQEHLRKFLRYMHPFLQKQQLHYRILVVEQNNTELFNRAKLMNIGFIEASRLWHPNNCFIFHDVDLLPINELNMYACTHNPRHMYSSLDTFRFHLPYRSLFGGAVAFLGVHFKQINGFSNLYSGWGGEDDDLMARLNANGLNFVRFDPSIASYAMLPHISEKPSPSRWRYYYMNTTSFLEDGLSTLKYLRKKVSLFPLYTHLFVTW